jgi:hypothetical protein
VKQQGRSGTGRRYARRCGDVRSRDIPPRALPRPAPRVRSFEASISLPTAPRMTRSCLIVISVVDHAAALRRRRSSGVVAVVTCRHRPMVRLCHTKESLRANCVDRVASGCQIGRHGGVPRGVRRRRRTGTTGQSPARRLRLRPTELYNQPPIPADCANEPSLLPGPPLAPAAATTALPRT